MERVLGLGSVLATILCLASSGNASAALFVVDTTLVDLGDIAPGDGKCEWATFLPAGQRCTLRAAVQEANSLAGLDVILIPDGWRVALSRPGTGDDQANTGDLDILEDVTIGSFAPPADWPVIDGGKIDRVFDVHGSSKLTLGALEVTGGKTLFEGGGIRVGSSAELEAFDCRLHGNEGTGGAVHNSGVSKLERCSVHDNRAFDNIASASAVHNALAAKLEIVDSAIWGNGFGLAAVSSEPVPEIAIRNTTISSNLGSGLNVTTEGLGYDVSLWNVTITDHPAVGFKVGASLGPLSLRNSIIAGNGVDCEAPFVNLVTADIMHPNLASDDTCPIFAVWDGFPETDPQLGPLQLNGGTTPSRVPRQGSPAIDVGDGSCEASDQRGASRPLEGNSVPPSACDLGAVEVLPCFAAADPVLANAVITTAVEALGCFTVTVGPAVEVAGGTLSVRARDRIEFQNGFSLISGSLAVRLDPAAGSGITLP